MSKFGPHHYYYDEDGNPISLREWGRKFEDTEGRIMLKDTVTATSGAKLIVQTMWHGMVVPYAEERLFGTAILSEGGNFIKEFGAWNDKEAAALGHALAIEALTRQGFAV